MNRSLALLPVLAMSACAAPRPAEPALPSKRIVGASVSGLLIHAVTVGAEAALSAGANALIEFLSSGED